MAARGNSDTGAANARPDVADILLVIHDFQARSADELSLNKGDRVELIERDDEFGDGWFLGKHLLNGATGLFPEVYTKPAPKGMVGPSIPLGSNVSKHVPAPAPTERSESEPSLPGSENNSVPNSIAESTLSPAMVSPQPMSAPATTLPLSSFKLASANSTNSNKGLPPLGSPSSASMVSPRIVSSGQESYVLSETLNVIDEHITETLRSGPNGGLPNGDSGSEYSSHIDHRMSYIQGEETDEEEDGSYTREEVMAWSADDVAEHLFTAGVEKHHCEVFRDQDITGEVLLGMDQTSIFIKAFDLGSVGRRLKTWQRIKALLDEVNGLGQATRRTTQTYGSDGGSERGSRGRSRTNTITSNAPVTRFPQLESNSTSRFDNTGGNRRRSVTQGNKFEPVSPVSPVRPSHEKRPSAASVRDLHHSRRHSSTDFRLTGTSIQTPSATPRLQISGTFPQPDKTTSHRKQPSFDRNWTLGAATVPATQGAHTVGPRPLSSAGFPNDFLAVANPHDQDSAVDLDRGYFSSTDGDGRRRNVLKKRDSVQHSRNTSYAEEQRVRSATAHSRHSHFGSMDSTNRDTGASPAAQKYYGIGSSGPHRRTASTNTADSTARPAVPMKDVPPPTVTKLDKQPARESPVSPTSPVNRHGMHVDWLSRPSFGSKSGNGFSFGLRGNSDANAAQERSKFGTTDSLKDSPMNSPARTGSSTPSAGPSFELDSPTLKSPSTATTVHSTMTPTLATRPKKKNKKETSAYLRGLQKISPREAMASADYSGWMKKKSSNLMTTWKPRLFVLKGRRLAYYYSEDDDQEKGLIDISFHRVLPADNERLTGLHATLTGATTTPTIPAGSQMSTIAAAQAEKDLTRDLPGQENQIFIFKLVPPRSGLTKAVNFTKPMVHYFAVPNIKQGRLWMAALMKATIDRDDMQPITTTYQQKTISLAKAQQMRHRPPALMNLDERVESGGDGGASSERASTTTATTATTADGKEMGLLDNGNGIGGGLGIVFDEDDSGVSGIDKMGLHKVESARSRGFLYESKDPNMPQSA